MTETSKLALYQELNESIPEIRLFILLPSAKYEAPLVGHLQTVFLTCPPPYEGLSYAWGGAELNKPITINEKRLLVTQNLDAALRGLRLPKIPRVLWVDAICINQQSLSERGHQVTLMGTIYSRCERDLLWLGPYGQIAPENSSYDTPAEVDLGEGLRLLSRIADKDVLLLGPMETQWFLHDDHLAASALRYLKEKEREKRQSKGLVLHLKEMERQIEAKFGCDLAHVGASAESQKPQYLLSPSEQRALCFALVAPKVWSRVWVMQELCLAPKIQIVAGQHTLDWDAISGFLGNSPYADAFHGTFGHGVDPLILMFDTVQTIDHQRRIMKDVAAGEGESMLIDVLARFRKTNSTDPRDKIYGLIGLLSKKLDIEVSYAISHQQLFANLTATLINESANLDIICQSTWKTFDIDELSSSDSGELLAEKDLLPSWSANFLSSSGRVELFGQRSIFTAGKPQCAVPCTVIGGNILRAKGTLLGRIGPILQYTYPKTSRRTYRYHESRQKVPTEWLQLYLGHETISAADHTYITGESSFTAFWRTLIVDCEAYPTKRLSEAQIKEQDEAIRKAWLRIMDGTNLDPYDGSNECFPDSGMMTVWQNNYQDWTFSITDNGLYVLHVGLVEEGDVVACLDGGKVPVVLRPVENEEQKVEETKY